MQAMAFIILQDSNTQSSCWYILFVTVMWYFRFRYFQRFRNALTFCYGWEKILLVWTTMKMGNWSKVMKAVVGPMNIMKV